MHIIKELTKRIEDDGMFDDKEWIVNDMNALEMLEAMELDEFVEEEELN